MLNVSIGAPAVGGLVGHDPRRVGAGRQPDDPPGSPLAAQARANAAMTWVLPVPAGATRQLISRAEVSRPRHASRWE